MRTSLLSAYLTAGQIIFPICLAIVVPSTASASQCKDLDVPYSWEAKILGESLVEVTQKNPSVQGLQKERDGKIQIKFLHQPPSAICAPPPPMPTTGLRVTAQAEYYYICNAILYCNDSPSHRSSFTIGNDSIY